ncbi:MAG: hypothetical protein A4S14_13660 [Proteobacteria bacterium SG_bin9]|nr:MAG: hypothetical protein A4S14_13660 [Proteobacteria bacterium SG_bin9]
MRTRFKFAPIKYALIVYALLISGLGVAGPSPAIAQMCGPDTWKAWTVTQNFRGDRAREEISGVACDLAASRCIAVNDHRPFAQLFSISGRTITPGDSVDLIPGDVEPDAEAAAFADGRFYVAGSHGNSRRTNEANEPSYVVARINAQTGTVEARSDKWRNAISSSAELGPYAAKKLDGGGPGGAGGANIEGLAVWKGRMYLGFRGPSIGGKAFVMSAALDDVFSGGTASLTATTHSLRLGDRTGIRDLAAVETGLLVLSGPVNDEAVTPLIWHWNPESGALDLLGQVSDLPEDVKAETILALPSSDASRYRLLLFFEGEKNGKPAECSVPKPN